MVGTSTVVVTEDNKAILQLRSSQLSVAAGQMHVSLAGGMSKTDLNSAGRIDPVTRVVWEWRQEMTDPSKEAAPMLMDPAWVKVLALGISWEFLNPEWAAFAKVPYTSEAISEQSQKARGKWERAKVLFVDFNRDSLARVLNDNPDWSPHATFALAMAMSQIE